MSIYKGQCEKCKKTAELADLRAVVVNGTSYRVCETCAEGIKSFIKNDYILPIKVEDPKDDIKEQTIERYLEEILRKIEARASLASFKHPKQYKIYSAYARAIQNFLLAMNNFHKEEKNE